MRRVNSKRIVTSIFINTRQNNGKQYKVLIALCQYLNLFQLINMRAVTQRANLAHRFHSASKTRYFPLFLAFTSLVRIASSSSLRESLPNMKKMCNHSWLYSFDQ